MSYDGSNLILQVTVQTRAARTEVTGVLADSIRIRLAAPPVDGRANALLIDFLASEFGIAKSRVVLLKGAKSRRKTVRIAAGTSLPGWLEPDESDGNGAGTGHGRCDRGRS